MVNQIPTLFNRFQYLQGHRDAVQLAKLAGARVIAVDISPEKLGFAML
jgi:hypothetical protein